MIIFEADWPGYVVALNLEHGRLLASRPCLASNFSLERRLSAFVFYAGSPAAARDLHRPQQSARVRRRFRQVPAEPGQHRHVRPFPATAGPPRPPIGEAGRSSPADLPARGSDMAGFPQYPRDFLPGDRQPPGLFFRPGQVPGKLLDPAAQPVPPGPGRCLPELELLDQLPHPPLHSPHPKAEEHVLCLPE